MKPTSGAAALSLAEAQRSAAGRIRDLRYGTEGKDYFWITDLQAPDDHASLPARPRRERPLGIPGPPGRADFRGVRRTAPRPGDAYVEYVWQWKDNPDRLLAPKQSYIKKFAPWDWIVGTGLYLDDVRAEIQAMASAPRPGLGGHLGALRPLLLGFVASAEHADRAPAAQGRGRASRVPLEIPDSRRVGHRGHAHDSRRAAHLRQPDPPRDARLRRRRVESSSTSRTFSRPIPPPARTGSPWPRPWRAGRTACGSRRPSSGAGREAAG